MPEFDPLHRILIIAGLAFLAWVVVILMVIYLPRFVLAMVATGALIWLAGMAKETW